MCGAYGAKRECIVCRTLSPVGKVAVLRCLGWPGTSVLGPLLLTGQTRSSGRGGLGRAKGWLSQNQTHREGGISTGSHCQVHCSYLYSGLLRFSYTFSPEASWVTHAPSLAAPDSKKAFPLQKCTVAISREQLCWPLPASLPPPEMSGPGSSRPRL